MRACLGFELITKNKNSRDEAFKLQVESRWCDLPTIMLTLVSFVNADSIAGVYEPRIR